MALIGPSLSRGSFSFLCGRCHFIFTNERYTLDAIESALEGIGKMPSLFTGGGLNHKLHQPTIRPTVSVKAAFLFFVLSTLTPRMIVNKIVMACHFITADADGCGFFTCHTYQPFRTTILP